MKDLIIIFVILVIMALAIRYIIRAKKKGANCIGCPAAGSCSKNAAGGCGCTEKEKDV